MYAATTTEYNARDQATQIRQYAGPVTGSTFQDTVLSYDGYGRLSSRHVPEQNSGTATVYAYNADDTVLTITDARGAITTHSYNGRHLLTQVAYSPPTGVAATPTATFAYDGAGNRTSMSDGLGSKSYTYDQLSRLMSETRVFTGVGSFALSYDYNLASQLKKVTDASNTTINYGYDVAGRLSGVTGADMLVAGVSTYGSALQYRAWGALKQISVGSLSTAFSYNSRVQTSNFNISGVVNENYTYNSDGSLKFVQNTTDNNFDRALSYDHAGRLTLASTGGAARQDTGAVPFYETFSYDPFNNLMQRETESWEDSSYADAGIFVNHRRTGWGYDASGRIATIANRTYAYDAAGRTRTLSGQTWNGSTYITSLTESDYDGDGKKVRENSGTTSFMTLRYYLHSSVLGGAVVTELNSTGQKQTGYVYTPSGTPLATQLPGQNLVKFKQASPLGTTERGVSSTGSFSRIELDPLGAKVRHFVLTPPDRADGPGDIPSGSGGALDSRYGTLGNPAAGCSLDGVYMPCYMAMPGVGTAAHVVAVNQFYAVAARTRGGFSVWVDDGKVVRRGADEVTHTESVGHFEWVDDPDDVLEDYTEPPSLQRDKSKSLIDPKLKQSIEDCAAEMFKITAQGDGFVPTRTGVPGTFMGTRIDKNGLEQNVFVVNENRAYTGWQLAGRTRALWPWVAGVTIGEEMIVVYKDFRVGTEPSGYSPYRNFTASDLRTEPGVPPHSWVSVQVWELGNSLGMITNINNEFQSNINPNVEKENGKRFTDCVKGKYKKAF